MFSENKKISERQVFRLLTYDLMGIGTLLIPPALGRTAGRDGIFCIVLGGAAGMLYLRLLKGIFRDMKGSFLDYLKEKLGSLGSNIVLAGYLMYFVLLAGYTAYLFSVIVRKELLREESFWLVLGVILLLVFYGMWEGMEGRARVYEILFWVLLIPMFLLLFSALNEIQTDYWTPVFSTDFQGIFEGSYYVFLSMSLVFLLLFSGSYVEKKERLFITGRRVILFAGTIYAVMYLILLGIFGADALGTMEYPAVTLMSTIKTSGGFLKRTDAFMFGIWFFTLYALLNSCVFYGAAVLRTLTGMEQGNKGTKAVRRERISAAIVLPAVLVTAGIFYKSEAVCKDYEGFLWYAGTPFLVLVPLLLAVLGHFPKSGASKRTVGVIALFLLSGSLLCGCGTAELEERSFPIELAVKDTDSFVNAWLDTAQGDSRVPDYNHLKVLILGKDFVEDEKAMGEFLDFLEKKADVPRNTYVVVAEKPEEMMEAQGSDGESIGNYLEQLFENVSKVKKKMYPTLGMLYQEKENHLETLLIPFVSVEEEKPVVKDYYVWKRGQAAGMVDSETALLSFFTQNGTEAYTILLEQGAVRLTSAYNEIRFLEEDGKQVVVDVYCDGEILYQKETGEIQAEQRVEAYMNACAAEALKRQIDVANSYRKLGGSARNWYFLYEGEDARYEEDIDIVYNVQITWINL